MNYINFKYNGEVETIDQFETYKEAKETIKEYRMAYSDGEVYLSNRSTKQWRDSKQKD